MRIVSLIFALLAFASFGHADCGAEQTPQRGSPAARFRQLDRNGDRKLTAEEGGQFPWFKPLDKNKDGEVMLGEVQAAFSQKREGGFREPAEVAGSMFLDLKFTPDYLPGMRDVNGQWMGGTEALNMAVHKGCLYAGIGYWQDIPHYEDKPGDPWVGAQILVKDGKDTPWKVDLNMGERVLRARALRVVAFEADAQGNRLSQPVEILLASGMNFGSPEILVWSRDDKANQWHKVVVDRTKVGDYLVALGNHRDHVTGVSHVFGFIANPRGAPSWNRSGGAGLFVRRADGTYQHFPVEDPSLGPHPFLYATRDVASSPWEPNVIYACGYDATANAALKTRALNTAWIYKGTFK